MSPHHSDRMSQISQIFYGSVFQNGVGVIQSVTKPLSEGQLKYLLIITVLAAERMITAGWVPVDAVWCAKEPQTKGENYLVDMLKKITSSSANNRQVVVYMPSPLSKSSYISVDTQGGHQGARQQGQRRRGGGGEGRTSSNSR